MRTNGVVPDEPVHQLLIEDREVVSKQWAVERNEVLRECPVEPLYVSIHLGSFRIGVEVSKSKKIKGA